MVKIYPFSTPHESKVIMESTSKKNDRIIPNDKPDLISHDNGKEKCLIIDPAIP